MGIKEIQDYTLRNILYLLWEADVSEIDFCKAIGINKSAVTDWKTGKTASYKKYYSEIANYFQISVSDLISEQLIVTRLITTTPEAAPEGLIDINARINTFQSYPPSVQDIGLDVMQGLVKRLKDDQ